MGLVTGDRGGGARARGPPTGASDDANARIDTDDLPVTSASRLALALASVKGLVQDHALLAVLEVQRAGISLVKMIAAGVIISILVVSAWMGIVAALVVWAIGSGANWGLALFVAALVNVAVAAGLTVWARKQVPDLLFSATLRQLRNDAPSKEGEHAPDQPVA